MLHKPLHWCTMTSMTLERQTFATIVFCLFQWEFLMNSCLQPPTVDILYVIYFIRRFHFRFWRHFLTMWWIWSFAFDSRIAMVPNYGHSWKIQWQSWCSCIDLPKNKICWLILQFITKHYFLVSHLHSCRHCWHSLLVWQVYGYGYLAEVRVEKEVKCR